MCAPVRTCTTGDTTSDDKNHEFLEKNRVVECKSHYRNAKNALPKILHTNSYSELLNYPKKCVKISEEVEVKLNYHIILITCRPKYQLQALRNAEN